MRHMPRLKQKHLLPQSDIQLDNTRKFKSCAMPSDLPIVMKSKTFDKCTSEINISEDSLEPELTRVFDSSQLKNENVVNYVLLRALHLNDICSSTGNKCVNRDVDLVDFPDTERFVKILHTGSIRPDVVLLDMDMNEECLEKNLLSFGLQRDVVSGDGNTDTTIEKTVSIFRR